MSLSLWKNEVIYNMAKSSLFLGIRVPRLIRASMRPSLRVEAYLGNAWVRH